LGFSTSLSILSLRGTFPSDFLVEASGMSSKSIYGVRMPGTLGDVANQLDGLRPLMAQKARLLIARAIARIATEQIDRATLFDLEITQAPLSQACAEVDQRIQELAQSNRRDPEVDTSFEVVACNDGEAVVLMSFTEHDDWFDDLLSLPGASDFSYWDGADPPEGVARSPRPPFGLRRNSHFPKTSDPTDARRDPW
jgi:hypothetical protein